MVAEPILTSSTWTPSMALRVRETAATQWPQVMPVMSRVSLVMFGVLGA